MLVRSKTDQSGAGHMVFIPYANGDRCPAPALQEWLKIFSIDSGHVSAAPRHLPICGRPSM
jgi:hypothetical protein